MSQVQIAVIRLQTSSSSYDRQEVFIRIARSQVAPLQYLMFNTLETG
jgi:hypothetical protein